MRDIDVLRQITQQVADADFWLFDPKDPVRGFDPQVRVYYHLAQDADSVTLDFMDTAGNTIVTYASGPEAEAEEEQEEQEEAGEQAEADAEGPAREAGSHSFSWTMRDEGWTEFEGRIFWAAGNIGPALLPGPYQVRLTVDGESQGREFEIHMNPRAAASGVTMADLEERYRFASQIRDRVSQANEAVLEIRDLKEQVDDRLERTDEASVEELAQMVRERLTRVEEAVYQTQSRSAQDPLNFPIRINNRLAALLSLVEGSENRPTNQSYEVYEVLSEELEVQLQELEVIIRDDVSRLNQLLREEGLPTINTRRLLS